MDPITEVRAQIAKTLSGTQAHLSFAEAVAEFPIAQINSRPPHVPYTFWHLIEHLRITQRDLLDYITRADYQEGTWPDDYWPDIDAETDEAGWNQSIAHFTSDLAALVAIANNPATDLSAGVPTAADHSIARCLLIVGNHNSYHLGELAILRGVMNLWGPSHT